MSMLSPEQIEQARTRAAKMMAETGIVLTPQEQANIEVADFGLSDLEISGLEIVTYINTDRYCAKEMVLFSHQTCPEHRHPDVEGQRGKRETFRCRRGIVLLYVEGEPAKQVQARVPQAPDGAYTVFHEIELKPGEQYTIAPNTRHWFQAGPAGAVVSEFSSTSRDEADIFSDVRVQRVRD